MGRPLVRRHIAMCMDHLLSMENIRNTSQKILLYLRKERLDSANGNFWQFGFSFTLAYFERGCSQEMSVLDTTGLIRCEINTSQDLYNYTQKITTLCNHALVREPP
jgi:hypothetical protein